MKLSPPWAGIHLAELPLMTFNLLETMPTRMHGAEIVTGRVKTTVPWGWIEFERFSLPAGWYEVDVAGNEGPVALQLRDEDSFQLFELSASAGAIISASLEAGVYTPKVFVGCRPGDYPLAHVVLKRLSRLEIARLLGRRMVDALKSGVPLTPLVGMASRLMSGKRKFALRTSGRPAAGFGLLTAADIEHTPAQSSLHDRVQRLNVRPFFSVTYHDGPVSADLHDAVGLINQAYKDFTTTDTGDYKLVLQRGETLMPDALLLLAETISRQPEVRVIICDTYIDGSPSLRIAFDPLLYEDGVSYPAPYAIKAGFETQLPASWQRQQSYFAAIGVPVAKSRSGISQPLPQPPVSWHGHRPAATIIIPTRDRLDLMQSCIDSLVRYTRDYELVIIDNGSIEASTLAFFEVMRSGGAKVVRADIPFNFSKLCNLGAAAANTPFLVFMNNDILLTREGWLDEMLALAAKPDIGAVGARLLYADQSLQHGGIALGLTEVCGHPWRGLSMEGQAAVPSLVRNSLRSAVTAALMCVERAKFESVGGFDEEAFPVTLNDVDLCLRLFRKGWYSAFAANALARHDESRNRGADTDSHRRARRLAELHTFIDRWRDLVEDDPWLSDAIMRSSEQIRLR